jgi:hypothetical protein
MKILAFDIANATGWAVVEGTTILRFGTERLGTKDEVTAWRKQRLDRRRDPRVARLSKLVQGLVNAESPIRLVVWEDVEFSSGRMQVQLWASLRTTIWMSTSPEIPTDCVNVTKLKVFATGNPQATKTQMMLALAFKYPDQFRILERNRQTLILHLATGTVGDDNAADAAHAALWAAHTYE